MTDLEQLKQDAIQVRHRMKRAQYADDLIAMDQYAAELGIINNQIKKHEDTRNQHGDGSGERQDV